MPSDGRIPVPDSIAGHTGAIPPTAYSGQPRAAPLSRKRAGAWAKAPDANCHIYWRKYQPGQCSLRLCGEQLPANSQRMHGAYVTATIGALAVSGSFRIGCCGVGVDALPKPAAHATTRRDLHVLNVKELWQPEGTQWCWAASSEAITAFVDKASGEGIRMCEHASEVFKGTSARNACCDEPTPEACKGAAYPNMNAFAFRVTESFTWLNWTRAKRELDVRPFAVVERKNGFAHMKVVRGYATLDGYSLVLTWDPLSHRHAWRLWDSYRNGDQNDFVAERMYYEVRQTGIARGADVRHGPAASGTEAGRQPPASELEVDGEADLRLFGVNEKDAWTRGLKLIRILGPQGRRYFGFTDNDPIDQVHLDCNEPLRPWDGQETAVIPKKYCIGDKERGVLSISRLSGDWAPVRIAESSDADELVKARKRLAALQAIPVALLYESRLGRFIFEAEKDGRPAGYLPLGPLPSVPQGQLVSRASVQAGLKQSFPSQHDGHVARGKEPPEQDSQQQLVEPFLPAPHAGQRESAFKVLLHLRAASSG